MKILTMLRDVASEMGDGGGASSSPAPSVSTPTATPSPSVTQDSVPATPKGVFGDAPETGSPAAAPKTTTKPTPVVEPAAQPAPVAPVVPQKTEVTLSKEALEALRGPQPVAQPAPTAFTPEEQAQFDRTFNIVRVSKERFKAVMGFEPENDIQLKAFESFGHDIAKQAVSLALYQANELFRQKEAALRETLAPIMSTHQTQRAAEITTYFHTAHPDLKDHTALIQEITAFEKAKGTKFKTVEEASNFVANRARELLKLPPVSGGQPTSVVQPQVQKTAMPTTMVGGRPGNPSSSQAPVSGPRAIFGGASDT